EILILKHCCPIGVPHWGLLCSVLASSAISPFNDGNFLTIFSVACQIRVWKEFYSSSSKS
ncbi:hypothetical protein, partial [Faecalibacillus intestinalis]|uniref:hypothetical protein n=1 Tax=Faecalibacillus intestinalis TaxID=1982626 RepID=UPI001EE142FE